MKKSVLIGIVLVVLGVLALGYEGITYVTQEEVLDIGPLDVDIEKKETLPFPRIAALIFLMSGIAALVFSSMKSSS